MSILTDWSDSATEMWNAKWSNFPRINAAQIGAMLAGSVSEGILFGLSQGYATIGYESTNQEATILGGMRALADAGVVAEPKNSLVPFTTGSDAKIIKLTGESNLDDAEAYVRGLVSTYGLKEQAWHYRAMALIDAAEVMGAHHESVGDWLANTGNIWLQLAGLTASVKEETFETIMEVARNDHENALTTLDSIGASAAQIMAVRAATILERLEYEEYLEYAEYALAGVSGLIVMFGVGWVAGKGARKLKGRIAGE